VRIDLPTIPKADWLQESIDAVSIQLTPKKILFATVTGVKKSSGKPKKNWAFERILNV
jgi:hypothetical protein